MAIYPRKSAKTGRITGYTVRMPLPGGGKENLGTYPKRGEAKDVEAEWRLKRGKRKKKTGAEWAAFYLEGYTERGLKSSTVRQAKEGIRCWLKEFGNRTLTTIERMEATAWARKHPGAVAPVVTMMNAAVKEEVLDRNVFSGLVKKGRGRKDKTPLTEAEIDRLAEVAGQEAGESLRAFVLVGAYTALRPGELYALDWENVDLRENYVTVKTTLSRGEHGTIIESPKNGRPRKVVLLPKAREALLRYGATLERRTGPVFVGKRGGRLSPSGMNYYWRPIVAAFGQGAERYDLRHFCANHLLVACDHREYEVATQLGHTDGGTLVSSTYGHGDVGALEAIRSASYGSQPEPTPPADTEAEAAELAEVIPFPKAAGE